MNPSRVTNADIDTDYSAKDRERVKRFLLKDRMNLPQIRSSEIITFNTIALKGAIKDVGRAFGMSIELTQEISNSVMLENGKFTIDNKIRKQYPDLFRYVDIVNGTIVSVGTHPSGVLVSDRELSEEIGLCTLSSSDYPVSSLNMKELDELMFVKLDILGLDNLGVINDCCKLAGIERLTPDNTPLDDENVWKSIREDTTLIFQWESESASTYLRKFMSDETIEIAKKANKDFSYIKWLSFGNGLIRPACASFRYDVADGDITTTGFKELDEFLSVTFGRVAMQEDIMQFLVKFCGYSAAESDTVRRGIAKKSGTEALLPEIERRFIEYSSTNYKIGVDKCKEIIKPMLQVLLDASSYAFSWNHSDAYSCIGYICGYLRYYYPVEFITSALNTFKDNQEKSASIVEYANKVGVKINGISFGKSKAEYVMDKKTNSVYKGIESIKYCNANIAEELYELSQNNTYSSFVELLKEIKHKTSVNSRQLEILTVLNFFAEFGENKKLLDVIKLFDDLYERKQIKKQDIETLGIDMSIFELCFDTETEKMYKGLHMDKYVDIVSQRIENKPLSIKEQIKREQEYLEYIVYTNPKAPSNMFYVVETKFYKDKTKPYLQLYNLRTGEVLKTKITSGKKFVENPFQTGSVLHVKKFTEKNKMKNVNGEWVKTDDKEQILTEWDVY